jgi:hypothetical protein
MEKVLKANYEKAVQGYVEEFCKRTDLSFDDWFEVGGNVWLGHYCFNLSDIEYHVNNDLDKDLIFEYHDVMLSRAMRRTSILIYEEYVIHKNNLKISEKEEDLPPFPEIDKELKAI